MLAVVTVFQCPVLKWTCSLLAVGCSAFAAYLKMLHLRARHLLSKWSEPDMPS
jgi:uncharacterized membrane protein YgdD (TMEM256/DUF423 family)